MDVHKPKPVHSWRELVSEIGVIVIGVAIALAGEQAVESLHWRHKVEVAEANLKAELSLDIAYAAEKEAWRACDRRYLAMMETAIVGNNADFAARLYKLARPFGSVPWQANAWDGAVSDQIPNRLPPAERAEYALAYRSVATARELQFQMSDHYAEAITGRFGLPSDPGVIAGRLAALGKLSSERGVMTSVSQNMLHASEKLKIAPDASYMARVAVDAARCAEQLRGLEALAAKS